MKFATREISAREKCSHAQCFLESCLGFARLFQTAVARVPGTFLVETPWAVGRSSQASGAVVDSFSQLPLWIGRLTRRDKCLRWGSCGCCDVVPCSRCLNPHFVVVGQVGNIATSNVWSQMEPRQEGSVEQTGVNEESGGRAQGETSNVKERELVQVNRKKMSNGKKSME
ncbi:unnamed protein product [Amaranthus hypochondriacus]